MSFFAYKALDDTGKESKGFLEAADAAAVYGMLSDRGLYVVTITESSRLASEIRRGFRARRIKRSDIIELANNLSVMLAAGVPLLTALGDIISTIEDAFFQHIVTEIKHAIEGGASFSDAVALHRDVFPDIFVRLVRIGEETGRLDRSLKDIADHLQKMEDLSQSIKRAMIYPAFAIVTTMGALIFWLAYVLPKILKVFIEMKVQLPFMTRVLIVVSNVMQDFWFLFLLLPVILFVVVKLMKQNPRTRYYVDAAKLRIPVVKLVVVNKLLALFSEQLRILITAGITIDRALDIIADVIGNDVFRRALISVKEDVSFGSPIADSLRKHPVFPPLVLRMVDIGESTGNLDGQFTFLSQYYIRKLDDVSDRIGKLVEPIVITIIGLLFAIIVIGLMFPIYELVSKMGK